MFIAYIGYVSCGVLPLIPHHPVIAIIGDNGYNVSPISSL
jgi:hypothetical protein